VHHFQPQFQYAAKLTDM